MNGINKYKDKYLPLFSFLSLRDQPRSCYTSFHNWHLSNMIIIREWSWPRTPWPRCRQKEPSLLWHQVQVPGWGSDNGVNIDDEKSVMVMKEWWLYFDTDHFAEVKPVKQTRLPHAQLSHLFAFPTSKTWRWEKTTRDWGKREKAKRDWGKRAEEDLRRDGGGEGK